MLPECLDWGRDRNPNWHRRWLLFLFTVFPLSAGVFCIFHYGPEKGAGAAALLIGTGFAKGLEYAVMRAKSKPE